MNKRSSVNKTMSTASNTSSQFDTSGKVSYKEMMNCQKLAIFSPEIIKKVVEAADDDGTGSVAGIKNGELNHTHSEQKEDSQRSVL